MEVDVVLENSPLHQYMASVAQQVDTVAAPVVEVLREGKPRQEAVRRRLSAFDELYAHVAECKDVRLEEDFVDVAVAAAERQAPLQPPRWPAAGMVVVSTVVALCFALASFTVAMLSVGLWVGAGALAWGRWREHRRDTDEAPRGILVLDAALTHLVKELRLSHRLIQEVHVVSRGYRVGALLPQVRLMGLTSPDERVCQVLLDVLAAEAQAVFEALQLEWARVLPDNSFLAQDAARGQRLLRQPLPQSGAAVQKILFLATKTLLVFWLRLVFQAARRRRECEAQARQLAEQFEQSARRIRIARKMLYRPKAEAADKEAPLSQEYGFLRFWLRNVKAKAVLLHERADEELKLSIARDLDHFARDWKAFLPREPLPTSSSSESLFEKASVFEQAHKGKLEFDIYGTLPRDSERQEVSIPAPDLEQVLELYLKQSEEEPLPKPKLSREERIRLKQERELEAKRAPPSQGVMIHSLMGELEDVLQNRRK